MKLVSVIIPCYNAEKYVGEAIQSALDQTHPDCEVIVIDDESTDGSVESIKSFGDKIRWEAGPNRGSCGARNRGIQLSRGEFIKFLDADDLLERHNIESQIRYLGNDRDKILYGPWAYLIEDGGASSVHAATIQLDPTSDILIQWLQGRYCAPHTLLWPKSILGQLGGWDESLQANQDGDLFIRAYLQGYTMEFCESEPVLYRRVLNATNQTISERRDRGSFQSRRAVLEKVALMLSTRGDLTTYSAALGEAFCYLTRVYPNLTRQELNECFTRGMELNGGRIPGGLMHRLAIRLLGVKNKELLSKFLQRLRQRR